MKETIKLGNLVMRISVTNVVNETDSANSATTSVQIDQSPRLLEAISDTTYL